MSDAMRTLRDGARQVQQLHKDLQPPTFARRDWNGNVFARHTLGDNIEVELWYLAENFLLAWHDWHTLAQRFPRYFGEPEKPLPKTWHRLDTDCSVLASRLLRDKVLGDRVLEYWHTTEGASDEPQPAEDAVREAYQTLVQNHRRWSLRQDAAAGRLEPHFPLSEKAHLPLPDEGEVWPRCHSMAARQNAETMATWGRLDEERVRRELLFHLRHYRHANLLVSWLLDDQTSENQEPSALLRTLRQERIVPPNVEPFLSQIADANTRGTAGRVLERVATAIGEIGYEEFVDDVSSSDFNGGPDSLVGAAQINLIPSRARGACCPLLLAVSRGDKKAIGFPAIMRQVRGHLIDCPETRAVIVLCDHWFPGMLDEHLVDLRAHHKKGVRFQFLMVGLPSRVIAPVAMDLGLAP